MRKWFTKPTETSSDPSTDIPADIDSEDNHSLDTVQSTTAEGVFEDRTASTITNIENDEFIDLASQVVGNSITVTDCGPVDTDFDSMHLQDDTAGTSIADTTSNQQDMSQVSDDATESSAPVKSVPWCDCQ